MELRIDLRKKQLFAINNPSQPIYYSGINPQSIVTNNGYLPNNAWRDFTPFTEGLDKLELTFSERFNAIGDKAPVGNGINMASSTNISFTEDAYRFIKEWLVDDLAATLNSIEVRVRYVNCADFEEWVIRHTQLEWCDGGICKYNVFLQQNDEDYQCIERTLINDNWQGWFPTDSRTPTGKKHPRFSYCNEIKPNGLLVTQWYLMTTMFASNLSTMVVMATIINPILWLLNIIEGLFNANWNIPDPINMGDITASWKQYFIESGGCGREHPAPLIRDYIDNACRKCGIGVNSQTAPIFFAQTLTMEKSTDDPTQPVTPIKNHYYNACYLFAPRQRGIRRFRNLKPVGYGAANVTDYWIPENAPDIALSDFLDKLKKAFNAEWRIMNGELYFQRKDWFKEKQPVYDFRAGSPDISKLQTGICYRYNDVQYPAYTEGFYTLDAGDSCGNEAMDQMNGFAVPFTQYEKQPNFGGKLEKTVDFGATRFNLDGSATCYYYDALQVVANGGAVAVLSIGSFMPWIMGAWLTVLKEAAKAFREWGDYCLLLRDENTSLPKILIWDVVSGYENAKAIRLHSAWPGTVSNVNIPPPNLSYNTTAWNVKHTPKTDVVGKNLTFPSSPNGEYLVTDYLGIEISRNPAMLVNYPMYYEIYYQGTLWDLFHWIDDPRKNPQYNTEFSAIIKLCCDEIVRLGLENDAANSKVGQLIKIPASQYYQDGKITEIAIRFDPESEHGRHIEIIGVV